MPRDPIIEAFRQRVAEKMNPSPDRNVDTEMAKFRRLLDDHLEKRRAAIRSGAAQEAFRDLRRRIVAGMIDLAPACKQARCRRAGECKGGKPTCIEDRRELVSERLHVLLGYKCLDEKEGKDADIVWPRAGKSPPPVAPGRKRGLTQHRKVLGSDP